MEQLTKSIHIFVLEFEFEYTRVISSETSETVNLIKICSRLIKEVQNVSRTMEVQSDTLLQSEITTIQEIFEFISASEPEECQQSKEDFLDYMVHFVSNIKQFVAHLQSKVAIVL